MHASNQGIVSIPVVSKSNYSDWWNVQSSVPKRRRQWRWGKKFVSIAFAFVILSSALFFTSAKLIPAFFLDEAEFVQNLTDPGIVSPLLLKQSDSSLDGGPSTERLVSAEAEISPYIVEPSPERLASLEAEISPYIVEPSPERLASVEAERPPYIVKPPLTSSDQSTAVPKKDFQMEPLDIIWFDNVVERGDNLSVIFIRNDLSSSAAVKISRMPGANMIKVLRVGDQIRFARDQNDVLLGIEFIRSAGKKAEKRLILLPDGDSFEVLDEIETKRTANLENLLNQNRLFDLIEDAENELVLDEHLNDENLIWHDVKVRKGDSLSRIFKRLNLPQTEAIKVADAPNSNLLKSRLKRGQEFRIAKSADGKFVALELRDLQAAKTRIVVRSEDYYVFGFRKIPTDTREHSVCTIIRFNLYEAAKAVKLPVEVVELFADLFESRIDFSRQLQKGDEYCVIYNQRYIEDTPIGRPNILAASLHQKDNLMQGFKFDNAFSSNPYYDQYGINLQGFFLRSPIKYARVTSVFSNNRFHPTLKRNRPHRGVDYGARTGTPIRATADGYVVKRRHENGYGKVILLRHGGKYETLYAHMSKFAAKTHPGSRVSQGQVIGYVGSTGLSTGPHLHYEFRVGGEHKDPLKYPLPQGEPIPESIRAEFTSHIAHYSEKLAKARDPVLALVVPESGSE